MNNSKQCLVLLALTLATCLLSACAHNAPTATVDEASQDICDRAARHSADCQGRYITPPLCNSPAALEAAEKILATACEDFNAEFFATGGADGAYCDWFGTGCSLDEQIFTGAACVVDEECSAESFCVEHRCFGGVLSEDFARVLDIFTQTGEVAGGQTKLLVDNLETARLRRELIENARYWVHFTTLLVADDESGAELVALFSAAVERGVAVRVVIDATTQYAFANYALLEQMAQAGVQLIAHNPISEWAGVRLGTSGLTANMRLHEKLLVVDGKDAIVGGRNIGDNYLGEDRWRDIDIHLQGPGVAQIQYMFLSIWDKNVAWERESGCASQLTHGFYCPPTGETLVDNPAFYPPLQRSSDNARTRAIYSDPFHQATAHGYFTTLALIRGARHTITIANAYFVPPHRLRKHLRAAAARGVTVNVLTNSKNSTDAWWMYYASLNFYIEMLDAGINIHEYSGTETMHSKVMLIDDELAVVGSFNLDPRSAIDNSEMLLLIRDGDAVGQLRRSMEADIANATTVVGKDIAMSELITAKAFRLVEPLL
ncbi:MAG: phosphatidylserine/phosphatidylglycerophosphate/cardiolipin synthase family protein [Bradymonadaceae bacterium]|nr:phosphatidylserine/phosphatidylglycerophosphate/cardiolipin synthase family protein [Lujinxingiaceae bacterium]